MLLVLSGAGGAFFFYYLLWDLPGPDRITERSVAESTKIYDRTGEILLYEIHGEERRTVLPLKEIPPYIKQAAIIAEDANFYRHHGIDWRGIARAFLKNIARGDFYYQGGSTITQQLVKNSILTGERTYTRKIKEILLAVLIEQKYSKDEILEWYLNQIPYGTNAYGIEAAAQTYFAKKAADVTLAEAAVLAALPKAPTYYSPFGSRRNELMQRKDWILERLREAGFVSDKEAERAKKELLAFVPPQKNILAPHFVLMVREYINQKYGEEFVERGGLKVITTLDWRLQEEAEKTIREGAERNEKLVGGYNASLVAIDPKTGEVLSLVGSRDYWADPLPEGCHPGIDCKFDPNVNVALRLRQPGSAFKPFVYATAFKKGYTPETTLFDVPTEFNPLCNPDGTPGPLVKEEKDCYHPQDYDGKFRGPVTLRQSLAQSLNVPSVKLLYLAGVKDSMQTARELGISTLVDESRYGLSLVLGGAEVTLLEMTSAFGVFAQEGILHPASFVIRVENSQGVLLEEKGAASLPVLDTEVARTINDLLSDNDSRVPIFNPRSSLYFPGRPVAAKTGTTQDFRDAWVVGYTPSLVAGVWVGNSDNSAMDKSSLSIMVAGPLWHNFLESALSRTPPEEFTRPSERPPENPFLRGLYRSGEIIKIDKISKKRATPYTPENLLEEMSFGAVSSILAHVRKEDPQGGPPSKPTDDPQFNNWEEGIRRWLAQNPLPDLRPPTAFDDIHLPEKRPRITLLQPAAELAQTIVLDSIIFTSAGPFPLREISVFIDDELMGSKTAPFLSNIISFSLSPVPPKGVRRIKIIAYDSVGNQQTVEKELLVTGN